MSVSALGSTGTAAVRAPLPKAEGLEGAGPDKDGDADDAGTTAASKAALPKGVGAIVDMTV